MQTWTTKLFKLPARWGSMLWRIRLQTTTSWRSNTWRGKQHPVLQTRPNNNNFNNNRRINNNWTTLPYIVPELFRLTAGEPRQLLRTRPRHREEIYLQIPTKWWVRRWRWQHQVLPCWQVRRKWRHYNNRRNNNNNTSHNRSAMSRERSTMYRRFGLLWQPLLSRCCQWHRSSLHLPSRTNNHNNNWKSLYWKEQHLRSGWRML